MVCIADVTCDKCRLVLTDVLLMNESIDHSEFEKE